MDLFVPISESAYLILPLAETFSSSIIPSKRMESVSSAPSMLSEPSYIFDMLPSIYGVTVFGVIAVGPLTALAPRSVSVSGMEASR